MVLNGMEDSVMDDPALPDTALLEPDMDANLDTNLDDLFGEAPDGLGPNGIAADSLGLPLPAAPIPPELGLRIMNMQAKGCCTKLAWSRAGSIAQITDNGARVVFKTLIRDPKTGVWSSSEESRFPLIAKDGSRWEHIQFSNLGTDLAAVTNLGHVHIHTLTGPLGRMPEAQYNIFHADGPRGDFDAVVGLHWLPVYPTEFKFPNITPAVKSGEQWSTNMQHRDTNEPIVHHAVEGRSALLHVSRDAKLTLMYQNEAIWHAVDTRLEDIYSSGELLSHAAMGAEGETVLLVTHDLSRRFRLYKITIAWNPTQHPRPGGQPPSTTVAPSLSIGRLTVLDHVAAQHADAARLSQLQIVPTISNHADSRTLTLPTIVAIFTRAFFPINLTQQHQEVFSVIARWHVETTVPTLHEAFSKLKPNGTFTMPQATITTLRRQEDILTNKLVLLVESQYFNTILAFAASDGSIEFRERTTMVSIEPYPSPNMASSLPQSGFEHLTDEHDIHVAMSPDGGVLASVKTDGALATKTMTLRYSWHPIMDEDGLIEAAVVCVARQYAILCSISAANDETLMLLPQDLSMHLRCLFVKQIIEMLGRSPLIDISMQGIGQQQVTIVREGLLSKALSAQLILGSKRGTTERDIMGKFAFAFLNLRLVVTSLSPLGSNKPEVIYKPDLLVYLRGLVRWGSEILVYIVSGLTHTTQKSVPAAETSTKDSFNRYTLERDTPITHLLLCSFTRALLRFLGNSITKYLTLVEKVISHARSVAERQQLVDAYELGTAIPFKYLDFDTFLGELDAGIRNAYNVSNITPARRTEIELSLIACKRPLPEELQSVLTTMRETALPKFIEKINTSKLYFHDTSWLGIEPSPQAHQLQYDIIRKVLITRDMEVKRCRRCGAMMEDLTPERMRGLPSMLVQLAKHCICSNFWVVDGNRS